MNVVSIHVQDYVEQMLDAQLLTTMPFVSANRVILAIHFRAANCQFRQVYDVKLCFNILLQ